MSIILGGRTVEVVRSDNLKEISLGPWEGKTRMETEQSHPDEYDRFWNNPDQFVLPGAETFRHLQSRVVGELDTIFRREKGRNMLVVSHWIAIKIAIAHYASTPLYQLSSIPDPINGSFLTLSLRDSKISLD